MGACNSRHYLSSLQAELLVAKNELRKTMEACNSRHYLSRLQAELLVAKNELHNLREELKNATTPLEIEVARLALQSKDHEVNNIQERLAVHAERVFGKVDNAVIDERIARSQSMLTTNHYIDYLIPQVRNPWVIETGFVATGSSTSRDRNLRNNVANHYRCKVKDKVTKAIMAKCCISQHWGDHTSVVAAHLLPKRSDKYLLKYFQFDGTKGLDDFRNVVLFAKNIEMAFDLQRVCFVKDQSTGEIILRILDPVVRVMPIFEGANEMIGDFEGAPMSFERKNVGPYTRVLSHHAALSRSVAMRNGWIPYEENKPKEYEYGSPLVRDTVTIEPRDLARHFSASVSNVSDPNELRIGTNPTEMTDEE